MQFFIAGNGGKERKMSTNNETIKIIANGAEGHALCPVIVEIAPRIFSSVWKVVRPQEMCYSAPLFLHWSFLPKSK